MKYQVVVDNIGTVYDGDDKVEAIRTFHSYVYDSTQQYGRVADEAVTLFDDGEPWVEHNPKRST